MGNEKNSVWERERIFQEVWVCGLGQPLFLLKWRTGFFHFFGGGLVSKEVPLFIVTLFFVFFIFRPLILLSCILLSSKEVHHYSTAFGSLSSFSFKMPHPRPCNTFNLKSFKVV